MNKVVQLKNGLDILVDVLMARLYLSRLHNDLPKVSESSPSRAKLAIGCRVQYFDMGKSAHVIPGVPTVELYPYIL